MHTYIHAKERRARDARDETVLRRACISMHLIVGKVVEDGRDGRGAVLLKDARELRVHITRASLVHRRSRAPAAVKCRAHQLLRQVPGVCRTPAPRMAITPERARTELSRWPRQTARQTAFPPGPRVQR